MSHYITPDMEFENFYQFPKFLLTYPMSQTTKLIYMFLLDRTRLSLENGWVDLYGVYIQATIRKLAEETGRSISTVKAALNELEANGLLTRRSGGFSKPNIIHVLLPDVQVPNYVKNLSPDRAEIPPDTDQLSGSAVVRYPTPNKTNQQNKPSKTKQEKLYLSFGRYHNVLLSQRQYDALKEDFPDDADRLIEDVSLYCKKTGKRYEDYEAAVRDFHRRQVKPVLAATGTGDYYSYEEGDSL